LDTEIISFYKILKLPGKVVMPTTITDTTVGPIIVRISETPMPFKVVVNEPVLQTIETVSVTLAPQYTGQQGGTGTLADPAGGGTFNAGTTTFTESGVVTGSPTAATQILNRLVYTPPTLASGNSTSVNATISANGVADPANPVVLETVTAPAITGTVPNQPGVG